mmetsp:Transcript_87120/g.177566  ORF Transcript_87120/g.177566 Transcript_87120/m.177566 type:complete len:85 (-) Transcript_87120:24-278(-)
MFVTSRQLDKLLFVNIALTTGVFAQTAVFFLAREPVDVARCCGVDLLLLEVVDIIVVLVEILVEILLLVDIRFKSFEKFGLCEL